MSLCLVDVFVDLQQRYGENASVEYTAAPSYLSSILGDINGKVVFLHGGNANRINANDGTSPNKLKVPQNAEHVDLNLTGSPLKDECTVNAIDDVLTNNLQKCSNPWRFEEECHKGMNSEGHKILNDLSLQRSRYEGAIGSIWVLCGESGIGRPLLVQYEVARKYFGRGIITYSGTSSAGAIHVKQLLEQHLAAIAQKLPVETSVQNVYRISRDISLRCSWSTSAALPLLVDLSSSCDVVLLQTFKANDIGQLTQHFFNQLRILSLIREDIIKFKEAEKHNGNKDPIYQCGCGIDVEELRESIYKVMTDICNQIEAPNELEADLETIVQRAAVRRLCDLTDNLWDIFKRCSSYKDLKYAFTILFQCAARCTIVNTPSNTNRLANIIMEISNKRLAIPCLTGSEPLELLLEIGLEKLFKDYEYIFTESKMCSATQLKTQCNNVEDMDSNIPQFRKSLRFALPNEPMNKTKTRKTFLHSKSTSIENDEIGDETGFKNSHFNEHETAQSLARLCQIHFALEHLLKIFINLNLRNNAYADICRQLLSGNNPQTFRSIDENLKNEQLISISAHEVREHLDGKNPHSRRITMKSNNKFREVKTVFYYNMENIFPPSISEQSASDDKIVGKDSAYHSWIYRNIRTFK